jgi:hypothetical protein
MAANVQFVFYKSSKKGAPILVKVMLNETEQKLPVTCNTAALRQNSGTVQNCPAAPYTAGKISAIFIVKSQQINKKNNSPANNLYILWAWRKCS